MLYPNGSKTPPRISSPYGPRPSFQTPDGRWTRPFHYGVDTVGYAIVKATVDGEVTFSGWDNTGYGNLVTVREPDGTRHRFAHHNRNLVRLGDQVKEGTYLGVMGSTGMSTAVHSHYEVLVGGVRVDPFAYVAARITAEMVSKDTRVDEDDYMPVVYVNDSKGRVYALNTITGERRALTSTEWRSVRRAYKAVGRPVPLGDWNDTLVGL